MNGARNENLLTPIRIERHDRALRKRRRPVINGSVRDIHPGQQANVSLPLINRLQIPLRNLGLIRRIRRQKLAAHRQTPESPAAHNADTPPPQETSDNPARRSSSQTNRTAERSDTPAKPERHRASPAAPPPREPSANRQATRRRSHRASAQYRAQYEVYTLFS